MRRYFLTLLTLGALAQGFVSGCAAPLPFEAAAPSKTLVVTPHVDRPDRRLLASILPYTRQDVATLVLKLLVREGDTETLVATSTLTQAELDRSVTFHHLRLDRAYRVRAYAYLADGTLISLETASFVDLSLSDGETTTLTTIPVRLIDRSSEGQAGSGTISVTDGGLVPAGVETLSQPTP